MTDYSLPPSPSAPPPPSGPAPGLPPKTPNTGLRVVIVVVIGLMVAFGVVVLLAAVTMLGANKTATTTTPVPVTKSDVGYSPATTSPRVTTTKAQKYVPTPADFQLEVVEVKHACFGSAGCNVTINIVPTYNGPPTNSSETFTVVYEIRGGGAVRTDNLTIVGDQYRGSSQVLAGIPANSTLSAEVTRIV